MYVTVSWRQFCIIIGTIKYSAGRINFIPNSSMVAIDEIFYIFSYQEVVSISDLLHQTLELLRENLEMLYLEMTNHIQSILIRNRTYV